MTHYGIIGSGTCGENIIEDGLSELGVEGNVFLVAPRKGAGKSEDRVFDFLIEKEAEYFAYTDNTSPLLLRNYATKLFDTDEPWDSIIETLRNKKGTLLVLWDDSIADTLTKYVFKAIDLGIDVKELSNGLAPYYIEDPVKPEGDVVEVAPFSEEELRSMSIGVLRKAAVAHGIEDVGEYSKDQLVAMLVDGKTHLEKMDEPTASQYGEGSLTWIENGVLCTNKLTATQVAWLIEELKTQPI